MPSRHTSRQTLVEHLDVVAHLGVVAGVGLEHRLQHVGPRAELLERDERHRQMVAEVPAIAGREHQLVV